MKFIRDIIADKRDQVPPQRAQVAEPRSDHDVMASILTDAAPAAAPTPQAFRLDSSFQVPEPQIEEASVHAEPEVFAEPDLSDYSDDEDDTDSLIAGLAGLGSDDTADFGGLEPDTFDTPNPTYPDEVPQQPALQQDFEDDEPSDVDFQRLAASVAAQQDAPQQRSFKRFTRTQTRLHTPELDEPEDRTVTAESAIHQEPVEPAQPAPLRQHPAPIRQRAVPDMPVPVVQKTTVEVPQPQAPPQSLLQPLPAARERVVPAEPAQPIDVPSPAMGRGSSRAGRVKTRLLGFNPSQTAGADPFADKGKTSENAYTQFPVGWLAVIKGPGRGATYTLFSGVTVIGRGEDQTVRLDFGDNSISRDNHAAIAFDAEKNAFFIGHGGKANLVRRNDRPVLSTEELAMGDLIRIGETTLRFVPLCGPDFGWNEAHQSEAGHAS